MTLKKDRWIGGIPDINWIVDNRKYDQIYNMNPEVLDVDFYWWFDDDGTDETDASTIGTENTTTDFDVSSGDQTRLLRVNVSESAGSSNADSQTYTLEFNIGGGGWNALGFLSTGCKSHESSALTNSQPTTRQLSGGGTFNGTSGQVETGVSSAVQVLKSNDKEFVYTITFIAADLTDADSIDFRVIGSAGGDSTVTMTVTPNATITKTAGGTDPILFRRRIEGI